MPLSVRVGSVAESYLQRATNLPPIAAFTIMHWWKYASDSVDVPVVMVFGDATLTGLVYGIDLESGSWVSTNNANTVTLSPQPTTGRWHHLCISARGASGNNFLTYLDGAVAATGACRSAAANQAMALGSLGSVLAGYWADQQFASIKIYDRVLSQVEIQREMPYALPVSKVGLNSYYPMPSVLDTLRAREYGPPGWRDWSGKRREWTTSGVVTLMPGPPKLG